MFGIVGAQSPQLFDHLRRDHLQDRRSDFPRGPPDDRWPGSPMPLPLCVSWSINSRARLRMTPAPARFAARCRPVAGSVTVTMPSGKPDPLDVARVSPDRRCGHSKQGPFYAGGSGVDGEQRRSLAIGLGHERPFCSFHHRSTTGSAQPENPRPLDSIQTKVGLLHRRSREEC
jgi:hypothetical protein